VSERLRRALTENRAETRPDADDVRLRGRTYAIPFDRVWQAALGIVQKKRRWHLLHSDDLAGVIRCECEGLVFSFVDDFFVRISLDENAQTRVDLISRSRTGKADLGVNARRIGRFVRTLDKVLRATPDRILDPTIPLSWSA
jgi:Protein of unknown function (DUF1499)